MVKRLARPPKDPLQKIEYLGDVRRVQPQPGDVFVITTALALTREQSDNLYAMWGKMFPKVKCLILPKGFDLTIANFENVRRERLHAEEAVAGDLPGSAVPL